MFHFIGSCAPTPFANGLALMTSVYYAAKVSGAFLNPSLTIVFSLLGFTHPIEAFCYMISQVGGCLLGALLLGLVVPGAIPGDNPPPGNSLGCFIPDPSLNTARIVAWEAVGTLMFLVPVMSVVWYTQHKSGYGNTGPIMIGIALMTNAYAVGNWTGAAFNPARVLGSALVYDCDNSKTLGPYIAGEVIAAFLAPFFIIPWYGICNNAWYMPYMPNKFKEFFQSLSPSIELKTLDRDLRL
jgi:glycerol uptake facilitator-like aquaporin